MNIQFFKYQGTGNDFVIMDNRNGQFNNLTREQVGFLCDRRFGIGADGLMLLNTKEGYHFEMKYYNADGAESSMCGNGGRCLVQFALDRGIVKDSYHFLAIDGPHDAVFDAGWVKLKMKDVSNIYNKEGAYITDTGSPHYVKLVNAVRDYNVVTEGRNIRNHAEFKENGINVNFAEVEEGQIFVRTYERGVEDETYSCGTGVTASALVCAQNEGFNRIEIETPGGKLAVEFIKTDTEFSNIWLCGPATFVFEGSIAI